MFARWQNGRQKTALKKKANVNNKNNWDETSLMCASMFGNIEVVEELLYHKADFDTKNTDGLRACDMAFTNNHMDVVELLHAQYNWKQYKCECQNKNWNQIILVNIYKYIYMFI